VFFTGVLMLASVPAEAAAWGRSIHLGLESVGMRNRGGELFSFVCGYQGNPELLGVEFQLRHRGTLKARSGVVMVSTVSDFKPSGGQQNWKSMDCKFSHAG